MNRYWFKLPGNFYAFGPTPDEFENEAAVRRMILKEFYKGRKKLPSGVEVWKYFPE